MPIFSVSKRRVELPYPYGHYPLKVACLPIPPPGHIKVFLLLIPLEFEVVFKPSQNPPIKIGCHMECYSANQATESIKWQLE